MEKAVFEDPEDDHLAFGHLGFEMESFLLGDGDEDVQGTAFQIGSYEFFVGIGDGERLLEKVFGFRGAFHGRGTNGKCAERGNDSR